MNKTNFLNKTGVIIMKKIIQKWLGVDTLTLMDTFIPTKAFDFIIKDTKDDIKKLRDRIDKLEDKIKELQ